MGFVELLKKAEEIVKSKFVWEKFIDGTPLANGVPVWMAEFALEEIESVRAQLKATQDKLAQSELELENSNRDKRALADKLERYVESTKKQKHDLRTELEAVKFANKQRTNELQMGRESIRHVLGQLLAKESELEKVKDATAVMFEDIFGHPTQSDLDKGFNEGLSEALISLGYATNMEELKCRIEAKKRKEVAK